MAPSSRVGLYCLCALAIAACAFDDNGLATGSNSAGTLESSGTGSSGGEGPTTSATTVGTTNTSQTTTTNDTGQTTVTTTTDPSDTTAVETGMVDTGVPETSNSTVTDTLGTSSDDGSSSSETGAGDSHYYANCTPETEDADCGAGDPYPACQGFYLEDGVTIGYVCYVPCGVGDACPTPDTGTATAFCGYMSNCMLDCAGGLICPDGMICDYTMAYDFYRCIWAP